MLRPMASDMNLSDCSTIAERNEEETSSSLDSPVSTFNDSQTESAWSKRLYQRDAYLSESITMIAGTPAYIACLFPSTSAA